MKERIHFLTKSAVKENKMSIHDIIYLRDLNVYDKNCFIHATKATSLLDKLSKLKVGVFLTPYNDIINKYWNLEISRIEKEKIIFGGKTRYEYENGL